MIRKPRILLSLIAALVAIVGGGYWVTHKVLERISPFGNMRPGITQSGGPLSYERAVGSCPIALPGSASNIQFLVWSLWRSSATFVRFEDAPDNCAAHARALLVEGVPSGARVVSSVITSTPPAAADYSGIRDVDLSWFDVTRITNGTVFRITRQHGAEDRPSPTIHVDAGRGVFYYALLD